MNDETPQYERHDSAAVRTVKAHQFFTMIVLVIVVSVFLVYVALSLYRSGGSVQLDLSRPGYESVREEVSKETKVFKGFPADGPIDRGSLNEFDKLYREKSAEALIDIGDFSGDSLSDQALSLDRD